MIYFQAKKSSRLPDPRSHSDISIMSEIRTTCTDLKKKNSYCEHSVGLVLPASPEVPCTTKHLIVLRSLKTLNCLLSRLLR